MKNRLSLFVILMLVCVLALNVVPEVAADDWKPVEPAHLSLKSPLVEKDADAEVLLWEVRINDAGQDLVFEHYIRIKIFTERGKEEHYKVDIPFLNGTDVKDIAGRTIKADGSIVPLAKDAVFERVIVKVGGLKIKNKSFAMPAVEPGSIIEYRWREYRRNQLANNLRLYFQREIPIQRVKYQIKPARLESGFATVGMSSITFNGQDVPIVKEKDGFYSVTMTNMPAFREEPQMPPEDELKTWMLLYYSRDKAEPPDRFWPKIAARFHEGTKEYMSVNGDVKKAAAAAIGDSPSPDEKIARLFELCRSKIKNASDDASGMSDKDLAKVDENKSPSDTLKRGFGSGFDINMLFAALATAAGFEARTAWLAPRNDTFFKRDVTAAYFLRDFIVAVKVGEQWRFFDPASTYVPYGMVGWWSEGVQALLCDSKQPAFVSIPFSAAEKSAIRRTAKLTLDGEGTLEGDIKIEYTGHYAFQYKENNDDESPTEREKILYESVKERMSTAELANIRIENVTDAVQPFVYQFHIRVPEYAQRTGKRLFLQPAFFQKGVGALFQTSNRKHPIYFDFPWSEEDRVEIALPEGYTLDSADSPGPFNVERVGQYNVRIRTLDGGRAIQYERKFIFGNNGMILFPVESYPNLKRVFDILHERDNHTLTLKQNAEKQ